MHFTPHAAFVVAHKRQKKPAENCDHSNHFFPRAQPTFSLKKHTTEIPVILIVPRIMLVIHQNKKNQGDRRWTIQLT